MTHKPHLPGDLRVLAAAHDRRRILGWMGAAALLPQAACQPSGGKATGDTDELTLDTANDSCPGLPPETAGPFPADGSNGPNVLALAAVVRSDIRPSMATGTGTAQGIPLTIRLRVLAPGDACEPLPGAALYVWQCDREGTYSIYELTTEDYLRGVQVADEDGWVEFTSVFPGCYPGRWPHLHVEIYETLDDTDDVSKARVTSQIALPQDACDAAYATEAYATSAAALAKLSLERDGSFRDGVSLQLAKMDGDVDAGFTLTLTLG